VNVAGTPLKVTALAPVRWAPTMSTVAPTVALRGEKPATLGAGTGGGGGSVGVTTVKLPAVVEVPAALVTVIGPVVAPAGTLANSSGPELKIAETPLNLTEVTPLKGPPVIATVVPMRPLDGEKPASDGATAAAVAAAGLPPPLLVDPSPVGTGGGGGAVAVAVVVVVAVVAVAVVVVAWGVLESAATLGGGVPGTVEGGTVAVGVVFGTVDVVGAATVAAFTTGGATTGAEARCVL